MSAKDQYDFFEVAEPYFSSIEEDVQNKIFSFKIGGCQLLFTPSTREDNIIYTGKLEIRLNPISNNSNLQDVNQTKEAFRKLRNWLKKHYWSRLAYNNKNKGNKLTPSRNYWLGPDAKLWKDANEGNRQLKLSKTSWMIFELGY